MRFKWGKWWFHHGFVGRIRLHPFEEPNWRWSSRNFVSPIKLIQTDDMTCKAIGSSWRNMRDLTANVINAGNWTYFSRFSNKSGTRLKTPKHPITSHNQVHSYSHPHLTLGIEVNRDHTWTQGVFRRESPCWFGGAPLLGPCRHAPSRASMSRKELFSSLFRANWQWLHTDRAPPI